MAKHKKTTPTKKSKIETSEKTNPMTELHLQIRAKQKKISDELFSEAKPNEVTDIYWIYATRKKGKYPERTENSGKWLIFVDISNIDKVWGNIKKATEDGLLGQSSKVATNRPNPNATKKSLKVICVYTYDCNDKDDVMRIREKLRSIGITNKIPYKTDKATLKGKYEVRGNKRISLYYE